MRWIRLPVVAALGGALDSLSVQELIDLVAYLLALKPPMGSPGHRGH